MWREGWERPVTRSDVDSTKTTVGARGKTSGDLGDTRSNRVTVVLAAAPPSGIRYNRFTPLAHRRPPHPFSIPLANNLIIVCALRQTKHRRMVAPRRSAPRRQARPSASTTTTRSTHFRSRRRHRRRYHCCRARSFRRWVRWHSRRHPLRRRRRFRCSHDVNFPPFPRVASWHPWRASQPASLLARRQTRSSTCHLTSRAKKARKGRGKGSG